MKKEMKLLYVFACLLFFAFNATLHPEEFDEFEDLLTSISDDTLTAVRSCEPGEAAEWTGYLGLLQIPKLFDEELYNFTSLPTHRNVINYPNFFVFSYQAPEEQQCTFHLFYNQTSKKSFTPDTTSNYSRTNKYDVDGKTLGSYLNVNNGTFLSVINEDLENFGSLIPPNLNPIKQLNFAKIFKTLANAHLEERRIGFLAHFYKQISPKISLEIKLPLLWEIRNINFDDLDKKTLQDEFRALAGNSQDSFDEVEFGKQHIVMDALGTGTLDITMKYKLIDGDQYDLQVGGSLYLPTDGHWKEGLYGTYFDPKDRQPILRFCDLVNITQVKLEPTAQETVQNFILEALHHFSSMVLQCPLGYNKHLGFALKALPYWQIRPDILYSGVYIFEYLIPHDHDRFFVKRDTELFSDLFNVLEGQPELQLDLIENQITERLFPRVFTTRVSPGFIFNTVSNFQKSYKDWNFTLGYNYWYKSEEKLSNIKASAEDLRDLDIHKATTQSASQIKVYGKIHRMLEINNNLKDLSFSLYGNATLFSDNIGNDFSLGISFDKVF